MCHDIRVSGVAGSRRFMTEATGLLNATYPQTKRISEDETYTYLPLAKGFLPVRAAYSKSKTILRFSLTLLAVAPSTSPTFFKSRLLSMALTWSIIMSQSSLSLNFDFFR